MFKAVRIGGIPSDHPNSLCSDLSDINRVASAAKVMALCALFELVLAAIGARMGGLTGLSLGWLVAICIEAVLMARQVFRVASLGDVISSRSSNIEIASSQIRDKKTI